VGLVSTWAEPSHHSISITDKDKMRRELAHLSHKSRSLLNASSRSHSVALLPVWLRRKSLQCCFSTLADMLCLHFRVSLTLKEQEIEHKQTHMGRY